MRSKSEANNKQIVTRIVFPSGIVSNTHVAHMHPQQPTLATAAIGLCSTDQYYHAVCDSREKRPFRSDTQKKCNFFIELNLLDLFPRDPVRIVQTNRSKANINLTHSMRSVIKHVRTTSARADGMSGDSDNAESVYNSTIVAPGHVTTSPFSSHSRAPVPCILYCASYLFHCI